MFFDQYSYLSIYLFGCVLVVILSLTRLILTWLLSRVTGSYLVFRNLKKISPPVETDMPKLVFRSILLLAVESLFSWFNVVVMGIKNIYSLFMTIVELAVIAQASDEIKKIRRPFKLEPDMKREAVWAHFYSLQTRVNERSSNPSAVIESLDELSGFYPTTDRAEALKLYNALNELDDEVVDSALAV